VLIFYPGDETPVCRKQLCEVRDSTELLRANNAVAFGINPQSGSSHKRFHGKQSFNFPLLVDSDGSVCEAYRTRGLMTVRTVYGIDSEGIVRFARRGKPALEDVLAALTTIAPNEIRRF
jgi:peroxiredoxin Q/BCP